MAEPLNILLVEDSDVDRIAVVRAVKKACVNVTWTETADVAAAVAALESRRFDCAVVDYMLPDGDASDVVRASMAIGEDRPPVIVLTGHGNELLAVELLRAGALDYLPKSELTPSRIGQSIRNVRRIRAAERHAERAAEQLQRANVELEARVAERTAELTGANAELILHRESLRALASQLSVAEERERQRIAGVLHDQIGPALASLKMRIQQDGNSPDFAKSVGDCSRIIDQIIQQTRSLTYDVGSPILYQLGLEPALENLAARYKEQHGVDVKVEYDYDYEPLAHDLRGVLFNAARECLFNVVKHADASRVVIHVERTESGVRLRVEDDGAGFDTSALRIGRKRQGYGLFSIQERLHHLGGTMRVDSAPGRGTRVEMAINVRAGEPQPRP